MQEPIDIVGYLFHRSGPGVAVHRYGKTDPRPGRKMGHVTRMTPAGDKV